MLSHADPMHAAQILCEFICAQVVVCLEDLVLLVSFISSGSSSISMLCSAGFPDRYTRDFMENITFRREFSRISHSLHFSTCGPFY